MESKNTTKRSANWGEGERLFAVKLILDKTEILHNKFRGASQGAKEKDRVWHDIAKQLNASGQASCPRTANEIKKMFGNIKNRAKDKFDSNTKTGGGPLSKLSPTEDVIITHLSTNNKSQLKGMDSGIDSLLSLPDNSNIHAFSDEVGMVQPVVIQDVFLGNNLIDSNNNFAQNIGCVDTDVLPVPLVGCSGDMKSVQSETESHIVIPKGKAILTSNKKKTSKRLHDDREMDLYDLERKEILAEIEMVEQKTLQNNELFLLKKMILEKELNSGGNIC